MLSDNHSVIREADIRDYLERLFADCMNVPRQDLLGEESFFSLGLTSLIHAEVLSRLGELVDDLPSTVLFEYPNLDLLAAHLAQHKIHIAVLTAQVSEVKS